MLCVIAGGVGAAKFLAGLDQVVDPSSITALVNVADDFVLHGLRISPDLDTVTYTLARAVNPETGWGLVGETWTAMSSLERYGGVTWFRLGDQDLATHLYRTQRFDEGATLAEITAEITAAWNIAVRVVPVSNDTVATVVTLAETGEEVDFQTYFVRQHHEVAVSGIRFAGAERAHPAPGVLNAIGSADTVIVAPSNPLVSIAPVLAVPGVQAALEASRDRCVAVSPIVGGAALKGPADRMLRELGHEVSAVGVARLYAPFCSTLVLDDVDAALAPAVAETGVRPVVAPTIMSTPERAAALARTVLEAL